MISTTTRKRKTRREALQLPAESRWTVRDDFLFSEREASLDERISRIQSATIEFHHSPEFDHKGAADIILASYAGDPEPGERVNLPTAPRGTPPYLAALYDFPLLSRAEEHHYFRQMNYLNYRADRLRSELSKSRIPSSVCDRIEKKLSEARYIRNHLVQSNLRLVVSIAKTIARSPAELDELISDGNVPLIRAVEIFDFQRGTRFSTYATWAIRHFLFRASTKMVKNQKRFLTEQDVSIETCSYHDEPIEEFNTAMADSPAIFGEMLDQLDDRSRSIIVLRFGLDESERPHKFREIAEKWGVSTERVRQLYTKAIRRLQSACNVGQPA
ncbi:MAG: sigma-70 family RNA polymerase sigma factor [Planctomycetaceae bacterium]